MTQEETACSLKAPPTCSEHDRRVAVIGAAGDSCDDHGPVHQPVVTAFVVESDGIVLPFSCDLEAFEPNLWKCAHTGKLNVQHTQRKNDRRETRLLEDAADCCCVRGCRPMPVSSCSSAKARTRGHGGGLLASAALASGVPAEHLGPSSHLALWFSAHSRSHSFSRGLANLLATALKTCFQVEAGVVGREEVDSAGDCGSKV